MGKYVTVSARIDAELRGKLAELGIKPSEVIRRALRKEVEKRMVVEIDEYKTSSKCLCGSENVIKRGRLFKCLDCGIEANRDAIGVLNIGLAQGANLPVGVINRLVAQPLLLRWDGMRWEGKSPVNTRLMSTLEARISLL